MPILAWVTRELAVSNPLQALLMVSECCQDPDELSHA